VVHIIGEAPPGQVIWHGLVPLHETWHGPRHSTTQVVTLLQVMTLPGPALTPQRSTLSQVYWQFAPQKAPHETVLWQSIVTTDAWAGDEPGVVWQVPVSAEVCRSTVTAKDDVDCPAHADPVSASASASAPARLPLRHGARERSMAFATRIQNLPHAMVGDQ
jgi:hypothetical protein